MPAFYRASASEFLAHEEDLVIGRQTAVTRLGLTELTAEQLDAWRQQVAILRCTLGRLSNRNWHLLLEYPIPRRGKRIDAVLIARSVVLVLEFKCGASNYDRQACIQVEDYCLDLRDFHSESRSRVLVPILVATAAEDRLEPSGEVLDSVAPIWLANENSLAQILEDAFTRYQSSAHQPIDPARWDAAEYLPTPTIIEAARALYQGQNVREISRCHAGVQNLTTTSAAVMQAIQVRTSGRAEANLFRDRRSWCRKDTRWPQHRP
jgi:hypothetical protein